MAALSMNHCGFVVCSAKDNTMQFAEDTEGEWRIFVGALEAAGGDGYIAALVVRHAKDSEGTRADAYRDDSLACGYRWATPGEAITYAMGRGRDMARKRTAAARAGVSA